MNDETDRVLLRACRRGDEAAARAFFARLGPPLLVYARGIVTEPSMAEDAVQNAFCKVFRETTWKVDRVEAPLAWMARIVRREALGLLRTKKRLAARERAAAEATNRKGIFSEAHPTPAASPEMAEVGRAIEALPEDLSEVVLLKHAAALTFDEIATALGINRNTAASRYRDALQRIRGILASGRAGEVEVVHDA